MVLTQMPLDEQRLIDMKIAWKFGEYLDVFESRGEAWGMNGIDRQTYMEIGYIPGMRIEVIPRYCSDKFEVRRMEKLVEKGGMLDEYVQLLNSAGVDLKGATTEQRCQALVEVPYTIPPPPPDPIVETPPSPPPVEAPPDRVSVFPALSEEVEERAAVEPKRDLPQPPDDWWLTYIPGENVPVIFQDKNGGLERVEAIWGGDNIFEIRQVPLRVNGVSLDDVIEVKWEEGDITPIFDRVKEKGQFGTIRVDVKKLSTKARVTLVKALDRSAVEHRIVDNVMVISYWGYGAIAKLDFRRLDWEFADEKPGVVPDDY